jgi:hypothetical protein
MSPKRTPPGREPAPTNSTTESGDEDRLLGQTLLEEEAKFVVIRDENLPPAQIYHEEDDRLLNPRLTEDQRRTAHGLRRLYRSLCGSQPGQYWPQALLDAASPFNRPVFPRRNRAKE